MYRRLAIFLLMLAGMSTWSHAQAQQNICSGATVPTGWVIVDILTNPSCGGFTDDVQTIEDISTITTPGATVNACAEGIPIPTNWVVQGVTTRSNCASGVNNVDELLQLKGFPVGTEKSICAGNTLPTGWSIVSTTTSNNCGTGVNNNVDIIRRNF
jgi:hypothetical protein